MLTTSGSGNTFICNDYIEIEYTKNMNNVLNQNINVTKRAWFATFANRSWTIYAYYSSTNGKQSKLAINRQRALRIKFHDHS